MSLRTAVRDVKLIASLLTTAEDEALALGDPESRAEHVLLAALLIDDPSARDALAEVSGAVDASTIRTAIDAVHRASLAAVGVDAPNLGAHLPSTGGVYRSEDSAQEVFQRARELSRRSRTGLRSAHVLVAAAEREHGTVARVLDHLAVDRSALVAAATTAAASAA